MKLSFKIFLALSLILNAFQSKAQFEQHLIWKSEVEKIVIEEIRNEFERRGIRANFCSIEGIHLRRITTS